MTEDDLETLDRHLAESGVRDEKLLEMARGEFVRLRRNEQLRGHAKQADVQARRITQQAKAVWEREEKARQAMSGRA